MLKELRLRRILMFLIGLCTGTLLGVISIVFIDIKTLNDQKAIIREQQALINSYVNFLDKKCPNKECGCDWLQAFYDEFHEEVGAFE